MSDIREEVRVRYAGAALSVTGSCCALPATEQEVFGPALYDPADLAGVPARAQGASLGCGNPTAVADLHPGEVVLDLGSGGGIDVFVAARRVGPSGKVYGLDMTDEMLDLARRNQREAGVENAEFLKGYIEEVPLPDASIDVVISNCVINLSADKERVFAEMARVLRPGGRIGISDVVAGDHLSKEERAARGSHVGCVAGALSFAEYREGLERAGFADVTVTPTHETVPEMYGAIVKAVRAVSSSTRS